MPRKPKLTKQTIQVIINGTPVAVILHPPTPARKSWFAYWTGLVSSRSTGQQCLEEAIVVAHDILRRWKEGGEGHRAVVADAILSDDEFEAVQRAHFARKTDPVAKIRAVKTLEECEDAITAFKAITGLSCVAQATPDDCARFQHKALTLPKSWRQKGAQRNESTQTLSPNTVLKWSRSLMAAFERVNRLAARRKCVRGVVDVGKLLTSNPWAQFDWIEGRQRPIRQFDSEDLLSLLSYLETKWPSVTAGTAAAKVFLWSSCRKLEIASLQWSAARVIGSEYHFEITGKWGVERWFRIPEQLYRELLSLRTDAPFVFSVYIEQLRQHHARRPQVLQMLDAQFVPKRFGRWFYDRVVDWSTTRGDDRAFVHLFRKTTLQYARRGEDINRQVASDARVSESVLMTNYVKETDEELRQKSNRTYQRILASLAPEVAQRYSYVESRTSELEERLETAVAAKNWDLAQAISARLSRDQRPKAMQ